MLNSILKLERPLAVLDLETTGLVAERDRIVQIAVTIHYPHREPIPWSTLVNPEIKILNSGVHGITNAHVEAMPTFKMFAPALAPKILDVDIAGHDVTFDIGFIKAEMARAGVSWPWVGHIIDTLQICRIMNPHTLSNAYKRFVDPAGFENAHHASNDVKATEMVLAGQLTEFTEIPRTVKELSDFCFKKKDAIDKDGKFIWINDEPCINFGKWRGTPISKIPKGYLIWMINTPNFPDEAIIIAGNALKDIYPVREKEKND